MQRPILLPNPVGDRGFVDYVTEVASDVDAPEELQKRLRVKYPAAIVRLRDIDGEQGVTWYVYRDGRWVTGPGQQEGGRDERRPSR